MATTSTMLTALIDICDDLAWGRQTNPEALFALTQDETLPTEYRRLAEAFGLMLVKIEAREYQRSQLIAELTQSNAELAEARLLLSEQNTRLVQTLQDTQRRGLVGQSPAMQAVARLALSIARRPINTLILGATGTGKEVVAKLIHYSSPRRDAPFIAVNCTAIPESLFESEMFGIEKGVATGVNARKGLLEESHKGTLFLDELADMTLPNQAKLLRALEEREVLRVGSSKPIPIDIKIIAATNVDLEKAMREGKFREDLYYRINVAEIRLPLLSERGDDILLLAQMFLDKHCLQMGRPRLALSHAARHRLLHYSWPGNVRELNNEMERAAALTFGAMVEREDLSPRILQETIDEPDSFAEPCADVPLPLRMAEAAEEQIQRAIAPVDSHSTLNIQENEHKLITQALQASGGNKSKAAELLGITREGLRKKILRMESM